MKYKTLETMRQTRLFLTEVIIPVAGIAAAVDIAHPEYKNKLVNKFQETKQKFTDKKNIFKVVK